MSSYFTLFTNQLTFELQGLLGKMPFSRYWVDRAMNQYLYDSELLTISSPRFLLSSALMSNCYEDILNVRINPIHIHHVLPSNLKSQSSPINFRQYFLGVGDLSQHVLPLKKNGLHKEALELFDYRDRYREMPSYQRLNNKLMNTGGFIHNKVKIDHISKLDDYFKRYLELLDSIASSGLLTRSQLKKQRFTMNNRGIRSHYLEAKEENVGIAISEEGELMRFRGGFHRFAFCQELELECIPVTVKFIHLNWLKACHHGQETMTSLLNDAINAAIN